MATGAYVASIIAGSDGRAAGVRLEDGSEFPADIVLFCAVAEGRWYGLWSVARQMGASAGGNAAGGSQTLAMPVPPYLVRAMGSQIASAGTIEEGSLPREALERLRREITDNAEAFRYAKSLLLECSKDSTRTANPESANLVAITETH